MAQATGKDRPELVVRIIRDGGVIVGTEVEGPGAELVSVRVETAEYDYRDYDGLSIAELVELVREEALDTEALEAVNARIQELDRNEYGVPLADVPAVLFHGTSRESAARILVEGLLTDQDRGAPAPTDEDLDMIDEPYLWDGVFLTDTPERALDHGTVVLRIETTPELRERVFELYEDDGYTDVQVVGSIDATAIKEENR